MTATAVQAPVAHLYNTLPTLGHADAPFVEREPVFKRLAELLAKHISSGSTQSAGSPTDGTPYEFTTRQTEEPPRDLVNTFLQITRKFNLQDILGFYHIEGGKDAPVIIERTEGRNNPSRILQEDRFIDERAGQKTITGRNIRV